MKIEYVFTKEDMEFYWNSLVKRFKLKIFLTGITSITSLICLIYNILMNQFDYKSILTCIIPLLIFIFGITFFYKIRLFNEEKPYEDENISLEIIDDELIEKGEEDLTIIKVNDIKKIIIHDRIILVESKKDSMCISNHAFQSKLHLEDFLRLLTTRNNKIKLKYRKAIN